MDEMRKTDETDRNRPSTGQACVTVWMLTGIDSVRECQLQKGLHISEFGLGQAVVESGENVTVVGDQGLVALAPGSGYFMLFLGAAAEGRMLWAQSFRWVTVANCQDCLQSSRF